MAHSDIAGIRHVAADRCVSRLELARALNNSFHIGAKLEVDQRADRAVPHLGRVELGTRFEDELAQPLLSPAPVVAAVPSRREGRRDGDYYNVDGM